MDGGGGSRVERYLAHLDRLSGGIEPRFNPIDSTHDGLKAVVVISYDDVPEAGMLTAFTYGLSLAEHPLWRLGKPELAISVNSLDPDWGLAVGFMAERLRGDCPFSYGNTINFGERVVQESALDAFVVFAPAVLARQDFLGIDVGDALHVSIAGMYPVHQSERAFIERAGLEAFWKLD